MVILLSVLLVLSLSICLFYNYHIVLHSYWYWIICLFMIVGALDCYYVQILLYAFRKVNGVLLKKVNQSLSDLESERVGLLNTLVVGADGLESQVACQGVSSRHHATHGQIQHRLAVLQHRGSGEQKQGDPAVARCDSRIDRASAL